MTANKGVNWELKGLGANHPEPTLRDELMLFGQFVGDWDIIENKNLDEDGKWSNHTGELHWNWIIDGRALQDVWMYYDKDSGLPVPAGTTLRFFDTEKRLWRSIWITPRHHDVGLFLGRKVGDEIVLEMQEECKHKGEGDIKWIFYDITPNSFKWRAEESFDNWKTYILKEQMKIIRH